MAVELNHTALDGQIALVTGSTRGIGAAIAAEFALGGGLAGLQVEQDQPDRQGAARFAESVVERALHGAGRLAQAEPDRDGKRCWHASQDITKHRHLID